MIRPVRNPIPRARVYRWSGTTLTTSGHPAEVDEADGIAIVVQWFGIHVELDLGTVSRISA